MPLDPNLGIQPLRGVDLGSGFPMDATGDDIMPVSLLAQYPVLSDIDLSSTTTSSGMDNLTGLRSFFDATADCEDNTLGAVTGPYAKWWTAYLDASRSFSGGTT